MNYVFCPQSVDWGSVASWVGGAATFLAVITALWLAKRETRNLSEERKHRGEVSLALAMPEISRLVAGFEELDKIYHELGEVYTEHNASRLAKISEFLRSPLENAPIEAYLDMPQHLSVTLPTSVAALRMVSDAASGFSRSAIALDRANYKARLESHRDFAS